MKPALVSVWVLTGIVLLSSAHAQTSRGSSAASGAFGSGSPGGSRVGQAQNSAPSSGLKSVGPRGPTVSPTQPRQFTGSGAVPLPSDRARFGVSSTFHNRFGTGHIHGRGWNDFRHRRHFRHPHFWRQWRFATLYAPGFVGTTLTAPYVPWTPLVNWGAWNEQGWPAYSAGGFGPPTTDRLAPFDPTPPEIVERMLGLAAVTADDTVYDLGAGDGRVVIAAAKNYGARAFGFELDPGLVKLARENVRREGVEHLVEIRQQDVMTVDLSPATVVTLYLSYDGNLALRPKLMRELKPGARLVSYAFDMAEWQPKVMESYRDTAGNSHLLYLWQAGEPMAFSDRYHR